MTGVNVKDPFLFFNIMCPAGSYDPNVEPAKDDVLFIAEDVVLDLCQKFFAEIYGRVEKDDSLSEAPDAEDVLAVMQGRSLRVRETWHATFVGSQLTSAGLSMPPNLNGSL